MNKKWCICNNGKIVVKYKYFWATEICPICQLLKCKHIINFLHLSKKTNRSIKHFRISSSSLKSISNEMMFEHEIDMKTGQNSFMGIPIIIDDSVGIIEVDFN